METSVSEQLPLRREVDIILNITQPLIHHEVAMQAVKNGKHVYNEKPLCVKKVEVPTHVARVLDFASGAVGAIVTSFDVYNSSMPCIEIYGTEGTLQVPDPNFFRGEVKLRRFRDEKWSTVPLVLNAPDNAKDAEDWHLLNNLRGIGITDMAEAISEDRPHRASGELANHVLDVMHGIHDASASGKYRELKSVCQRPEPMI